MVEKSDKTKNIIIFDMLTLFFTFTDKLNPCKTHYPLGISGIYREIL